LNETRFIVWAAGGDSASFVEKHIKSISKQVYDNYIHVIIDDATKDGTDRLLKQYKHDKLTVIRNDKNQKWCKNAVDYLDQFIESDDDVILIVDLDDWLSSNTVLAKINEVYNQEKCWMTYGNFAFTLDKHMCESQAISFYNSDEINNKKYRKTDWKCGHPRSFKAFLWKNINKEDLKDSKGNWLPYTYDKAIMFPILEMCPPEKIVFINEVLYVYNKHNPKRSSAQKTGGDGYGGYIRKKSKYNELVREEKIENIPG
jgi:glycosyltransferase involved in cell wall biosynthesis